MWTGYGAAVVATDVQRCRYPMPCDDVMVVLWCPLPSAAFRTWTVPGGTCTHGVSATLPGWTCPCSSVPSVPGGRY